MVPVKMVGSGGGRMGGRMVGCSYVRLEGILGTFVNIGKGTFVKEG